MIIPITTVLQDWGWIDQPAPNFVMTQAEEAAKHKGKKAGEIIVALGLATDETVAKHMRTKPANILTVQHLAGLIDNVAAKRQRIFALMDGLLYWEFDISSAFIPAKLLDQKTDAWKYCNQQDCVAWTHPADAETFFIAFSDYEKLTAFRQMGRAQEASNALLKTIGTGAKRVLVLTDHILVRTALNVAANKENNSLGNESDKLFWSSSLANSEPQKVVADILNEAIEAGATDIGFVPHINGTCTVTIMRHGVNHISKTHGLLQLNETTEAIRFLLQRSGADKTGQIISIPKDGAMRYASASTEAFLRLSFIPQNMMGAKHEMISLSIRVLTMKAVLIHLEDLRVDPMLIKDIGDMLKTDKGLLLISAPTNNGKSTTVAGINQAHIERYGVHGRRRVSLEQPVERNQEGMIQFSIEGSGLFPQYVKAIFRHNPDYCFIGECRDPQATAAYVRVGTSGHLGLSTTHARDEVSAFGVVLNYLRSFDASKDDALYVQPSDFVANISLSISQRLVPHVCPACAEDHVLTTEEIEDLKRYEVAEGYRPQTDRLVGMTIKKKNEAGCDDCGFIGTVGELPVFGWLVVTAEMREMMLNQLHERGYIQEGTLKDRRTKTLYESAAGRLLAGEIDLASMYI